MFCAKIESMNLIFKILWGIRMKISYKKLWKLLIDKDMLKKDLQQQTGISWATITRMSRGEPVSMEVLMKICGALNCNVGDVVDFIDEKREEEVVTVSVHNGTNTNLGL